MNTSTFQSVSLLPSYFQTDKNTKFLSSTIDQLIRPAQLERIDGFIGSKVTPNYVSTTDNYISNFSPIRSAYNLEPALVINDINSNIKEVVAYDDLINQIAVSGGITDNLDRLFRSEFYSYNPHIDWDKLVNYQEYYWLVTGPDSVTIRDDVLDVDEDVVGKSGFTTSIGTATIALSNGMLIEFVGKNIASSYVNKKFFVEGVGTSIVLIDYNSLVTAGKISTIYNESFDGAGFDEYPFDGNKSLPISPEYITINRASKDLNAWSRYNRWVHQDVITASALANGVQAVYPALQRATRPIIEFKANLQLFNFGDRAIANVDWIDTETTNVFKSAEGAWGYFVDFDKINPKLLGHGDRVIFTNDPDPLVKDKVWIVNYNTPGFSNKKRLALVPALDHTPVKGNCVSIVNGGQYAGSSWWYNGTDWVYAQQHTKLNEPPLFDLFDDLGNSYSDSSHYISDFTGNQIFGYTSGDVYDKVLGFKIKYQNSVSIGSYLFTNYFNSGIINVSQGQNSSAVSTAVTYCKFSEDTGNIYANVWTQTSGYQTPILQFQSTSDTTSTIAITAVDKFSSKDHVEVFVDFKKLSNKEFTVSTVSAKTVVSFATPLVKGTNVLFKLYSMSPLSNNTGYYESPLGLTNNPLNGLLKSVTLTDLQQHIQTMAEGSPNFSGKFPGLSNLRDISGVEQHGRRLISNVNPIPFAQMFIGKKEHNVINALTKAADQYNQYKLGFLKQLLILGNQSDPILAVDQALAAMNVSMNLLSPYYLSDMVPYGTDVTSRTWTVTDSRNVTYPLGFDFDPTVLSLKAMLVYVNGEQLLINIDYKFNVDDSSITILKSLTPGDVLTVNQYPDTSGSYVPPTPTKLGLYPKFAPSIYLDDTYADVPVKVIQGHDGSIMVAYNDYRDAIVLEFEKRIYNNIKTQYRSDLFDINTIVPGAFVSNDYLLSEVNTILSRDFIKWAGAYGVDYTENLSFNQDNKFTWNYAGSYNELLGVPVNGYWRGIYKYFYGTDRPHTCPWEMLGFSEQPSWWTDQYGPAPYTSGNAVLWQDLESGRNASTDTINVLYARPGLSNILPVDEYGNLLDPTVNLLVNYTPAGEQQNWVFGDQSPAETTWRRSSYFPFAVQKLLALTRPATYASLMYDTSRIKKNIAGQWTYGTNLDYSFLSLKNITLQGVNNALTAGYSVYVSEVGRQRTQNYNSELQSDLDYFAYNLFHKVGGFVSQNTLQVTINAIDPTATSPGALLAPQDYSLILNVSNPISYSSISGIILQKVNGSFVVKGYDQTDPYFNVYGPLRNSSTPTINVGGVTAPFVTWSNSNNYGQTGLTADQTTTANTAPTGKFYHKGQYVQYGNNFYIVTVAHQSENTFNPALYQQIPSLPITGGATVQIANGFDNDIVQIPYGTTFNTIQEVYDFIIGYGAWLTDQGFVFDLYNADFGTNIDWNFTAKEFLYWSTQNWADNSVIALSPFAEKVQFISPDSAVDDIFDPFYSYNVMSANGTLIPKNRISITRQDGVCTISALNSNDGIYFAVFRNVQKEHGMVFNNTTIFDNTAYSIETGFYQQRMKISGFRTASWNGDYFSPGFIYDTAHVSNWSQHANYNAGDAVYYSGNYYSAINNIDGAQTFDFTKWQLLPKKPVAGLLPNLDYKISQFQDFYSLDIDNFDSGQQHAAQHLTGYTPRPYLTNIIIDPIAQYKFYQGYIREKGTYNAIAKLAKASVQNLQGNFTYNEEWAFRVGQYGSYSSYQELEVPLVEGTFIDNPQVVVFTETTPPVSAYDLKVYSTATDWQITPPNYVSSMTFAVNSGTLINNNFVLPTAGYVRIDDASYTTLNLNTLINVASNAANPFKEGDTIWLGFKQDNDWDILRYTESAAQIVEVDVNVPGVDLTVMTNNPHGLVNGELISIAEFNSSVDGVYMVTGVPSQTSFLVSSTATYTSNFASTTTVGLLFKFDSFRFNTFDNLPNDSTLLKLPNNTKVWVDDIGNGQWGVYEKINNYSVSSATSLGGIYDQQLGWSISKRKGSNVVVVGSPGFEQNGNYGRVTVYLTNNNGGLTRKLYYYLNELNGVANALNTVTRFGQSVVYDDTAFGSSTYGLIFAGAPYAQTINGTVDSGLVKVSSINSVLLEEVQQYIIKNPQPTNYALFGSGIYVQRTTNSDSKTLVVTAPGTVNTGTGSVYVYNLLVSNGTSTATLAHTITQPVTIGSQWGYSVSGSDDASIIAISALGNTNTPSFVNVYTNTNFTTPWQTITSIIPPGSNFGQKVLVSPDGNYLFISAPYCRNLDQSYGCVYVYTKVNGSYELSQTLSNPSGVSGVHFGTDLDITEANDSLVISSMGSGVHGATVFDVTSLFGGNTTFDADSTKFYDVINNSGTAYLYNRQAVRFVFSTELSPVSIADGTDYGKSVVIDSNVVLVGAPAIDNSGIDSSVYLFNKIDPTVNGWQLLRSQSDLIATDTIQRVRLINTSTEEIVNYLDVIDPLKGRIAGMADQELTYKMISDPATYSVGSTANAINTLTNWTNTHIGELWWDLSTVKYQWYEQGEDTFRKNTWGHLFPGATIDVYEWVGSNLLPSEWSVLADTPAGLIQGISGQPKNIDDSAYSVVRSYDTVTQTFNNYTYYYWVKNKVIVPPVANRRVSAYDVARVIKDPTAYGLQYTGIISPNSVLVANVGEGLTNRNINLNISIDRKDSVIPKHTEWLLLQEGNETSLPNSLLEKKLVDSLLGHDKVGNLVPDPKLTSRTRYGIGIRPRQTMFVNRLGALRNLIEFANNILINNIVTGSYNFSKLNSQEEIPPVSSNLYDYTLEDTNELDTIDPTLLSTAELTCTVYEGRVRSVVITNAGYGYTTPPTVTVDGVGSGAVITTEIDSKGRVVRAIVANSGQGYVTAPVLTVRPYSVVIISDSTYNGKWAIFVRDVENNKWVRVRTQAHNTTLYWNYVDWSSKDFNQYKDYTITVDHVYQINSLSLNTGNYVKVKNNGLGNSIILEYTDSGLGTFSNNFNIVHAQNGTIQISDKIWDTRNNSLAYDEVSAYDQTLYDQTPDLELNYILTALRDNIFVNELKVNWNLFFFKAVKYAFTEQKLLDWAFKTSFISITNEAGKLSQPPVYLVTSSTNFENYIEEVKPYHTQIRNFTEQYSVLEPSTTYTSEPIFNLDITLKFDRISYSSQLGNTTTTDQFICNGSATSFVLSWPAVSNKSLITMTLDGLRVLWSDYTIEYFTQEFNGYTKKYCQIKFLNTVPGIGQLLKITYVKDVSIQSAADRILNYYTATSGMPGLDLGQLMLGVEYPRTQLQTLAFNATTGWDESNVPFGTTPWGNDIEYYSKTTSTALASVGTDTVSLFTASTALVGQYANIISTITNVFYSTDVTVTAVNGAKVIFSSTLTSVVPAGAVIEFYNVGSNSVLLDTSIDGGTWTGTNAAILTGALGVNPSDIIIDGGSTSTARVGDGFINSDDSYAPEELVAGATSDSLGINVYTKTPSGAPIIISGNFNVVGGTTSTITLPVLPTTTASITVTDGFQALYTYTTATDLISGQFSIDWTTSQLNVYANYSAVIGYTIISVGGGSGNDAGVVGYNSITVTDAFDAQVYCNSQFGSVNSAFVTVNGGSVQPQTTSTGYGYILGPVLEGVDNRAAVTVHNLPPGTNTIQAWFFTSAHSYFNEIVDQFISITDGAVDTYALNPAPGNVGPAVANVIVQQNSKQLVGPYVSYYTVTNDNLTFKINNSRPRPTGVYAIANNSVEVYVNGIKLSGGFDFTVDNLADTITISYSGVSNGDVVAVVDLYQQPGDNYDFNIEGSNLILASPTPGTTIRVITFTDQDGMLLRTERFKGTISNQFKITAPPLNTNYLWLLLNGVPLVNNVDYQILNDGVTIQISDKYLIGVANTIVITYLANQTLASTVLGYRIFNDIFNRTSFKRISAQNSTYLTQPLQLTDTEIHVNDASVLTPSVPSKKIPGVVIIAGERIEFFVITGNVLSQLRRATLGTSPKTYSDIYTVVIDQSPSQTIPFNEHIYTQTLYTTSTTATYTILTATSTSTGDGITLSSGIPAMDQIQVYYGGYQLNKVGTYYQDTTRSYDSPKFNIAGFTSTEAVLPSITVINTAYVVTSTNQVWIYTNSISADAINGYTYTGLNYLPPEFSITATQITVGAIAVDVLGAQPPNGSGWVLSQNTATQQIAAGWTLIDANGAKYPIISAGHNSLFNGWGFGLAQAATIAWPLTFVSPVSQQITLNTLQGVGDNIKLVIIKKEFSDTTLWNNGISLLDSTTEQAKFIQARPAVLPNSYYGGGDPDITIETGFVLTDQNNNPIEGL